MNKLTLYRVDHRELQEGDSITSPGDHIDQLQHALKMAERELRRGSDERSAMRSESLYAFENLTRAKKYFILKPGSLYELEATALDVRHKADMMLVNRLSETADRDAAASIIEEYWAGGLGDGEYVEVLLAKAVVRKRLYGGITDKVKLKQEFYS